MSPAIPAAVGVLIGLVIALAGRWTRFDHDRSFYPTILIVIASYYVLFACLSGEAVAVELTIALAFGGVAIVGGRRAPLLVGVGIALHGVFDLAHPALIDNPGVPLWWPPFCAAVDVVLGVWVVLLVRHRHKSTLHST